MNVRESYFHALEQGTLIAICGPRKVESKSVSIDRYLLRPLGLEIDYLNHRDKREHIYLTFQKPEDRQKLYHKMISQVRLLQIHPVWFIRDVGTF